jgi:hypothetical protein
MKTRIIEVKRPHTRIMFVPQYKNSGWFSRWRDLSSSNFSTTIFCHTDFIGFGKRYVSSYREAKECIDDFKEYLKSKSVYMKIHNV